MISRAYSKTDVRRGVRRKFGSADKRELMSAGECPQKNGVASVAYTRGENLSAEVSASTPVLRTQSQHSRGVRDCPQRWERQSIPPSWPLQASARQCGSDCRNAVVLPHWAQATRRVLELGHAPLMRVDEKIVLGRCDAMHAVIAARDGIDAIYSAAVSQSMFPRGRQPAATPVRTVLSSCRCGQGLYRLPSRACPRMQKAGGFDVWRDMTRDIATRERRHVRIFRSFAGVAGRPRLLSTRYLPALQGSSQ